jgi:HAD superfamily hydrolase (TIGR01509 family)
MLKALLFDFGGVLAEEGFREGLKAIGEKNGLDPDRFFSLADTLIFDTGYLTGRAGEAAYWDALRERTGITGSNEELREDILKRFILRPGMVAAVDRLRSQGFMVAMLSDQTNWLDELDRETTLSRHFDKVFNSFKLHKSKRDASVFRDVCGALGVKTGEALFIDDNIDHIRRAADAGLHTIHFTSLDDFEKRLTCFVEAAPAQSRS